MRYEEALQKKGLPIEEYSIGIQSSVEKLKKLNESLGKTSDDVKKGEIGAKINALDEKVTTLIHRFNPESHQKRLLLMEKMAEARGKGGTPKPTPKPKPQPTPQPKQDDDAPSEMQQKLNALKETVQVNKEKFVDTPPEEIDEFEKKGSAATKEGGIGMALILGGLALLGGGFFLFKKK